LSNPFFQFKQFTIFHDRCAMKVTTDGCLFGAWVAKELREIDADSKKLLDAGTGTGLLSLMIAQKNGVKIEAVEIDAAAAGQAVENIRDSPWAEKIEVLQSDILEHHGGPYDFIVSNPPFYEQELTGPDPAKNLAHHSHQLRLKELLEYIKLHLELSGYFFLLLPYKRIKEIQSLFSKLQLFPLKTVLVKQTVHHAPFRCMIMGKVNRNNHAQESTIVIKNGEEQYTGEFVELLKDYYLYL
jgi:tRNA1Val (adenine37-N6)-methyltransferase